MEGVVRAGKQVGNHHIAHIREHPDGFKRAVRVLALNDRRPHVAGHNQVDADLAAGWMGEVLDADRAHGLGRHAANAGEGETGRRQDFLVPLRELFHRISGSVQQDDEGRAHRFFVRRIGGAAAERLACGHVELRRLGNQRCAERNEREEGCEGAEIAGRSLTARFLLRTGPLRLKVDSTHVAGRR